MAKNKKLWLIKTPEGIKEAYGFEIALLQLSRVKIKILKRLL